MITPIVPARALFAALLLGGAAALAQELQLAPVPDSLPAKPRSELQVRRSGLQSRWDSFQRKREAFSREFSGIRVDDPRAAAAEARRTQLKLEADAIVDDADRYNEAVAGASRLASPLPLPEELPEIVGEVIDGLLRLAEGPSYRWGPEKREHLRRRLLLLPLGGPVPDGAAIDQAWAALQSRKDDPTLVAEADRAGARAWAGAGTQTKGTDCALFALARATGLPYPVVAARATSLVSEAAWRSPRQRADPVGTLERGGLAGGELVFLAELLGRAEVLEPSEFPATLSTGNAVMVNLQPGAAARSGHEVVLTGSFRHEGQTWFVVMDSLHGPTARLFAPASEIETLLMEKGVVVRPPEGTVPRALR